MSARRLVWGDALKPYMSDIAALLERYFSRTYIDFARAQIVAVTDGPELLAVVVYSDYRGNDIEVSIASASPRWATRDIIRALFEYPFVQLRTDRITAITPKNFKHVRSILERLGFRLEGVHRKAFPDGKTACTYGILKEECRWLKKGRRQDNGAVQRRESAAAA